MKLLASLGADIDLHPKYKPNTPPGLVKQRTVLHSAMVPHEYIPTEMEYNVTSWTIDHFGIQCSSPFVYDPSLPKITNPPDMQTVLKELGVKHKTPETGCKITTHTIKATGPLSRMRWRRTKQSLSELQSSMESSRNGVRVLCLDGGGMRGLIQLEILRQIEQIVKLAGNYNNITDMFDYIVGTSTGGITALALVYGK